MVVSAGADRGRHQRLPTSIVQRIEILREGASSIYGSDAIAGVINVITDTALNGITLDAFADTPTEYGANQTYRASLVAGKTFSRGHLTGAVEYRDTKGATVGDNPDWRCPRELAYRNGEEIGHFRPGTTELRCFPYERAVLAGAEGYGFARRATAPNTTLRLGYPGWQTGAPNILASRVCLRRRQHPSGGFADGLPEHRVHAAQDADGLRQWRL